ncbi:MAG: hypothetical protein ACR2M2_04870 [Gaiellaceae bacterium]
MTTPSPENGPAGSGNFWSRRSRLGKAAIIVVGLLVAFAVIGALAPDPDTNEAAAPETTTVEETQDTAPTTTEEAPDETTTEEAPTAPPEPTGPPPVVIRGSGSRVVNVRLAADSPLVVTGTHRGSSNFIVDLVGRGGGGEFFLFNEIGTFSGQMAVEEATRGRYRASVQADGTWVIRFEQPEPPENAKRIPGTIKGTGAKVVPVRSTEDLQPVVTGRHRGQSNFIVDLVGYGDLEGSLFIFNEIGVFQGETLADEMPAGDYLLYVQADGPWTIKIAP